MNMLQNYDYLMGEMSLHRASQRGHTNSGWMDSYHSFSFGEYFDKSKMAFGSLRVLNDDAIYPLSASDWLERYNLEVVHIVLSGELRYTDHYGNYFALQQDAVQVISCGTGTKYILENSTRRAATLLTLWFLPKQQGTMPREEHRTFIKEERYNFLRLAASCNSADRSLFINQDVSIYLGSLSNNKQINYKPRASSKGVYAMCIDGEVEVNGALLDWRDAASFANTDNINFKSSGNSELLIIDLGC
jgi:redox-sensitive bicupin YhaK (pirin superfamily)